MNEAEILIKTFHMQSPTKQLQREAMRENGFIVRRLARRVNLRARPDKERRLRVEHLMVVVSFREDKFGWSVWDL